MMTMLKKISYYYFLLTLFALPFLSASRLSAQRLTPVIPDSLAVVHYEDDTLYIASDSTFISLFFNKLDNVMKTGEGSVSILHIGGSHVQAGTMSNRIRQNILRNCPDAVSGRGMIFPYSTANKCNNPIDYRVRRTVPFELVRNVYKTHDKRLGACGIAVYSADSNAAFTIRLIDSNFSYGTTRVTLLGYPCDTVDVLPSLVLDGKEYFPEDYSSVSRRYVFDLPVVTDTFMISIIDRIIRIWHIQIIITSDMIYY